MLNIVSTDLKNNLNFFVELEREVWEALKNGDSEADARLLSDDFLGVYETGFSTKEEHVSKLLNGPLISEYQIKNPRLLCLGEKIVSLTYSAIMIPIGNQHNRSHCLYHITSIWEHRDARWINIFSQDTRGECI